MENAAEALMMGFAVLIFVIALTVGITVFSQVISVSDAVLYSYDETNYYDYQGAVGKASQNRIVGLETIIPTLYKYYGENFTILFREGSYDEQTGEFGDLKPLNIYDTPSRYKVNDNILWGKGDSYDNLMKNKYSPYITGGYNEKGSKDIFSFDVEEESQRYEPWIGSVDRVKENLDCFLNGGKYINPSDESLYIDYSKSPLQSGGFIAKYKNKKFVETVGEYTYEVTSDTEDGNQSSLTRKGSKSIYIYTLITN